MARSPNRFDVLPEPFQSHVRKRGLPGRIEGLMRDYPPGPGFSQLVALGSGLFGRPWTFLKMEVAEDRGFEPLGACTPTDFKSAAFDRSASPPRVPEIIHYSLRRHALEALPPTLYNDEEVQ